MNNHNRKPYYFKRNAKKNKKPKQTIEFDKDLDYLVQTRDTVISVVEFVLRGE